jgi:hypothetical protein
MKCAMPCPRIYLPVCGSDGQTHANRCEMKRYACEHDTELEVVHLGKCTGPSKRPDVQTGVWGWAAEWSVGRPESGHHRSLLGVEFETRHGCWTSELAEGLSPTDIAQ